MLLNKVWADSNNQDNFRPGQITVTLHRKWTENGQEYSEIVPGYNSFPITGSLTDDTWQKKIQICQRIKRMMRVQSVIIHIM